MKYTQFGKTSLNVSVLSYGTWQFGGDWGSFEAKEAQATIRQALDLGINFFDTAQAFGFGVSERVLGDALAPELKHQRDKIVLATKGGLRMEGDNLLRDASPKWLRQGVEQSLRNLGVDYIDLYQVHWPDKNTPFSETASTLEQLVQEGKIRYVGVSNYDAAQMQEFEKTRKLDSLQPPYHLFRRDIEASILPYCREHGVGVLVYGPLAHGLLAGSYTSKNVFASDDWRSKSSLFHGKLFEQNLGVVERLKELAGQLGITAAQLAVAWVLANPAVDVAIVGARKSQHLVQAASAADVQLSADTLRQINQIMQAAASMGGPTPEGM